MSKSVNLSVKKKREKQREYTRKYRQNLTDEQREVKRQKDREYRMKKQKEKPYSSWSEKEKEKHRKKSCGYMRQYFLPSNLSLKLVTMVEFEIASIFQEFIY